MFSDMSRFVLNWVTASKSNRCTFRNFAMVGEYGAGGDVFNWEPAYIEVEISLPYKSLARLWSSLLHAKICFSIWSLENQLWSSKCFSFSMK